MRHSGMRRRVGCRLYRCSWGASQRSGACRATPPLTVSVPAHYSRITIGNIPPAEAEERYYAMLEQPAMAAWLKPNGLRRTRGGSMTRKPSCLISPCLCRPASSHPACPAKRHNPRAGMVGCTPVPRYPAEGGKRPSPVTSTRGSAASSREIDLQPSRHGSMAREQNGGRGKTRLAIRPASEISDVSAKESDAAREEYHRRDRARH